jgi:hypothetical protein
VVHSVGWIRRAGAWIAILSAAAASAGAAGLASPGASVREESDQGVFVLSQAGREIGTETFTIKPSSDRVEAEAQIELRAEAEGKAYDFKITSKLAMDSELHPLTYAWNQQGAQSSQLSVDFRATPATAHYRTVAGETDDRQFGLPRDVVVLDDNVIHHYQLVVERYRQTSGGKQTFRAFVPQEALSGSLVVEDRGLGPVEVAGAPQNLRHLAVTTDLARIDLWADDHGRVQRVSIPAAGIEAVRK